MISLKDKLLKEREQFHKEALEEWKSLTEIHRKYVSYLLVSNKKYSNPNNSHLLYALGISDMQPVGYIKRIQSGGGMCDIDMDIADDGREKVLQYVRDKYGHDTVSSITTYGSLKSRGAIKAVARALGASYEVGEKLSKLALPAVDGVPPKLAKCYEAVAELKNWHKDDKTIEGLVLNWADKVEDRIDHSGVHASGYIIGDRPLNELVPLQMDKEGQICSQWDMNEVEKIGLVKFDFLGLTALSVISKCLKLVKERQGIDIVLEDIPEDDAETFKRLQAGDTAGIFQIETSSGMKDLMIKMQPKSIDDLGALTAIFRPGPLASKGLEAWLKVRSGSEQPEYLVKELKSVLSSTDGFLIYQEQCMKMAVELASYTLPESDDLRKAIGKKLPEEMAKHESKFKNGLLKNGFKQAIADKLWADLKAFAAYGFNKSHAIAYGFLAYQTAYLKTHFPTEYMCAALTCKSNDEDQVIKYIFNCRDIGIKVLPPDINKSNAGFSIDDSGNIRFGLAAVKNLGENIVDLLIAARGHNLFKDLLDFISRVDTGKINKRKIDSLILAGAFDYTNATRASMVQVTEDFVEYKKLIKAYESKLETFEKKSEAYKARLEEIKLQEIAGKKTKLKPFKQPEKPIEPTAPFIKNVVELAEKELLTNEKELLGFYVSGHPVARFASMIASDSNLKTIDEIKSIGENSNTITLIAIPCSINERTTKSSGKKMASMLIEDCTGSIHATAFPKTWETFNIQLTAAEPLLLKCKINIADESSGSGQAELIIMNVSSLNHIKINPDTIDLQIKLTSDNINTVRKLLQQYSGDETNIRLSFISSDQTEFSMNKLFSIRNRDSFVKELTSIQ